MDGPMFSSRTCSRCWMDYTGAHTCLVRLRTPFRMVAVETLERRATLHGRWMLSLLSQPGTIRPRISAQFYLSASPWVRN